MTTPPAGPNESMSPERDDTMLALPFGGLVSFLRSPACSNLDRLDADVGVLGFPSDEGSGWVPGARFGPRRMREVSMRFSGGIIQGDAGFWDLDGGGTLLARELSENRIVDCGDVDVTITESDQTWNNATRAVRKILDAGALPVVLGGDHAITYPVVRAFDETLTVVQFDAHLDYQQAGRISHSHAHQMRLVSELDHVSRLVQVGIRSFRIPRDDYLASIADGNVIVSANRLRAGGREELWHSIPAGGSVYVTIDVDVLDPPLVPGTVSAEPSGLSYDELRGLLVELASHARVVGFDLVEVNPLLDIPSQITSFLGVQIVVEFLGHIMGQRHEGGTSSTRAQ